MKTNEAPEKIYISPHFERRWFTKEIDDESTEYTRTDAFIEKATEWLKKNADDYTWYDESEGESGITDEFIEVFKTYMKGEKYDTRRKRNNCQ